MKLISVFLLLLGFIGSAVSYKVLIFNPAYGASHSNFLGKIADILIDGGHEVTMLIPTYLSNKRGQIGSKKVKNIVEMGQDPRTKAIFESGEVEDIIRSKVWTMHPEMMSLYGIINEMNVGIGYQCEYIFQQTEILEKFRDENFDLAITESLFACPFAVFDHIGIKTVINAESNLFKDAMKYAHGEPAAISYFPGLFSPDNDKMSFFTRAMNLARMMFTQYLFGSRYQKELKTIRPYYNGTDSWTELVSRVAFYFINSNQYLDYASPTLPKTVFVGGMQVVTNKKKTQLNKHWDSLLSLRKQNVLISFGSNAHSADMPDEYKKSFLEVFASMPETTFIWKYEDENATLANHLENVHLTKWMPQNDLLADERLTLFVTHGGLGSTMELAYQGKPALIIPLLADQPRNAHMLTRHGGSIQYDKKLLGNSEKLGNALRTVLNDKKYADGARRLASILNSQPFSPKDVVLSHCNFAVEHGPLETLSSQGKHLNFFQYYSFDIAIAVVVLAVLVFVIAICLVVLILSYKVLVFNPALGGSHSNFLGKISDILIDAGNEVTMLIPVFMDEKKDLVGSKKVKNIIRVNQDPRLYQMQKEGQVEDIIKKNVWKVDQDLSFMFSMIANFSKSTAYQTEYLFQQIELIEHLRNEKFDLAITESLFVHAFAFFEELGIPAVINTDSTLYMSGMKEALGEPSAVSYYPSIFSEVTSLDFIGRVKNFAAYFLSSIFDNWKFDAEIQALPKSYKGSRDWKTLLSNVAFNFVNSNPYIDYPTATLPKTVFVGGMQVNTKKSGKTVLSKEWDDVLSQRETNVLVSFGSMAYSSYMPDEFKKAFLEVFASMPETTFIWKYEEANATLANHLPNVKLTTWMPQNDLLADDRLNLFVTHGGLGSSVELAYQGKPAVVIPLLGDQPRNAHMLARHGGAIQFDKRNLDKSHEIKKAIESVLKDSRYKINAQKLAKILEDQPNKPKDVVLKHCDFAVQFGPLKTLNSEGRHLNTFQYYSIDIAAAAVLVLFIVLSVLNSVVSYKVLVFNPAFGASHSNFLGKISDILIDAGHEVTMFIPVFVDGKKDLVGSKKVKNIVRLAQDPRIYQMQKEAATEELMRKKIWTMDSDISSMLGFVSNFSKTAGFMSEHMFEQTDLLEQFKKEKFDLGITESLFVSAFALFDEIGIKSVINADSTLYMSGIKSALGEPSAIGYYPGLFSPIDDKMNFFGRVKNLMGYWFGMQFSASKYVVEMDAIPKSYKGPREWRKQLDRVAFNFINSNQYIDYASPTLPKTVFVGGMQVNTKKSGKATLSKEWNDVLSQRKTNVLVSFGSNAFSSDMPDEFKKAFLEVFASMPDTTFIWKYEEANATLADHLPNVKLTTWMPQNDILADDRLTLFVTHGGLGSSVELAYQGKPAVVIPLMADQPRNAHMLTRHGGALLLDKTLLDQPKEIKKAIETVLNDSSFKKNAQRLANILEDQPNKPKDVVLKHCDFAVQYGPLETLNCEGRNLNIFEFYSLDIALAVLVSVLVILFVLHLIVKFVFRLLKRTILSPKKKAE